MAKFMLFAMVPTWTVLMLVFMFMGMVMRVRMVMFMVMNLRMSVVVVMSTNANRVFPRQSAAAFFTHYSISIEASSISRPARRSPLGL